MNRLRQLLAALAQRYSRAVGPSRKFPALEPVRHLAALDDYVGQWVAVKNGRVQAAARSSTALAAELQRRWIRGATIQFVEPPTRAERVGLG